MAWKTAADTDLYVHQNCRFDRLARPAAVNRLTVLFTLEIRRKYIGGPVTKVMLCGPEVDFVGRDAGQIQ